jgi:hypothetical protein
MYCTSYTIAIDVGTVVVVVGDLSHVFAKVYMIITIGLAPPSHFFAMVHMIIYSPSPSHKI